MPEKTKTVTYEEAIADIAVLELEFVAQRATSTLKTWMTLAWRGQVR